MPKVFVCPVAQRGSTDPSANTQKDYGINGGTNPDAHCCPERTSVNQDGIAFVNSKLRITDVTDGSSNTFLFVEEASWNDHSWLPDSYGSNQFIFVHHPSQGYVCGTQGPNNDYFNNRDAASFHPNGVQAVMADGHFVWVSNDINLTIYRALFSRAAGEAIGEGY
jgi:prepilin-type processing-associated H-X9-DG protein